MTIFLILAPYGAFATLMLFTSAAASLFAATAICLMVIAYDAARRRSIKMLGAGSAILFTALAGRANDPLWVFLGLQQQIMTTRESLRRLGLLCGIHFGIARPVLREDD